MATPHAKRGRPPKFSKAIQDKLIEAFSFGYDTRKACLAAGICHKSFYTWLERHPEFKSAMESAQVIRELRWLREIENAGKPGGAGKFWTSRAWLLQRSNPMRYAPEIQLTLNQLNVSGSTSHLHHPYFSHRETEKALPAPIAELPASTSNSIELTFEDKPVTNLENQRAHDREYIHPSPPAEPARPLITKQEPEVVNQYMAKLRRPTWSGNPQPGPLRNTGNIEVARPAAAGRRGDAVPIDHWTN